MSEYDLDRFVKAQKDLYDRVVRELTSGRKSSHWMWFVFPQIAGLGFSAMAQRYAVRSRDEAETYLAHKLLGPRLEQCTQLVLDVRNKSITDILGSPDDMKFRSSMTLFHAVSDRKLFSDAIARFYPDGFDPRTISMLAARDR